MTSAHNLALLKAIEDFANTGPKSSDWLYLKKKWPGFLPDAAYQLPFDGVLKLNRQYPKPQTIEWWKTTLPDLLTDGITIQMDRGPNREILVTFTLFPLLLQEIVRRLWRDPAGQANQVLPNTFIIGGSGDHALRDFLEGSNESRRPRSSRFRYAGPLEIDVKDHLLDQLDSFRDLMRNVTLEVDWRTGTLNPKFGTALQQAVYLLLRDTKHTKFCRNPSCPSPYFTATRTTRMYCSTACFEKMKRESKLRWWNRVGNKRRKKRKRPC